MNDSSPRTRLLPALAWLLLLAMLIWSRSNELSHGLANDEAFTAAFFIARGPRGIFFHEGTSPIAVLNNHRLFSLLTWFTISAFGSAEQTYRFWSWMPGILAVVLAAVWVARRIGSLAGLTLLFLVLLVPQHASLTEQARGYGLGFLAGMIILVGGIRCRDNEDRLGPVLLGVGGLIGIATLPVFVLAFLSQSMLAGFESRRWREVVSAVAVVGTLSAVFHGPMIRTILLASGQDFGWPVPWVAVIDGSWRDMFRPAFERLLPGRDPSLAGLLLAWIAIGGAVDLWCRGERGIVAAAVVPVVFTYGVLAASGVKSVPRFASFLLFHECLLPAAGTAALVSAGLRLGRVPRLAFSTAALILSAAIAFRFVQVESRESLLPVEDYRTALERAYASGAPVYTNSTFGAGFEYYGALKHGRDMAVRAPGAAALKDLFCDSTQRFAYVHYPLYGEPVELDCLLRRKHTEVMVPQRAGGPDGSMTVYVASRVAVPRLIDTGIGSRGRIVP